MVRLASLKYLARYIAFAINTNNPKQLLIVALAISSPVLGHILAMQRTLTMATLETPNVPMKI